MSILFLLLLVGAAVCFAIAAFVKSQPVRINFVALGLLLWVLVPLLQTLLQLDT